MLTPRPLALAPARAQVPASGTSWSWLTSAAEMAATTGAALSLSVPRRPSRLASLPRIATRTPSSDLASVAVARDFARGTLQRWGLAGRCDDITLVVSELLANALRHTLPQPGGWPVRLGLLQAWQGSAVLCAVADPSRAAPIPGPSGEFAETGRGLHVVAQLSDRWGYTTPGRRGKVVWATFHAE
jgi:anti-sigma regulatory factor (Ser/Thr protein kinase)